MAEPASGTGSMPAKKENQRLGSTELFRRTGMGKAPKLEPMPDPDIRARVTMRDLCKLDTYIWLPRSRLPAPAILSRTPYQEHVVGWARLGMMRYVDSGYALVIQMIRGTGRSEGQFIFNAPHEKPDGYDTVEWIAAQSWCDGNVGMDGGSYAGMTQLSAAAASPPQLRCIAVHVPSTDFFRESPYFGGAFCRQHMLNWNQLISIESLSEMTGGYLANLTMLAQAEWVQRMLVQPPEHAAEGLLSGDQLQYFRDVLAHPTLDDWWRERTIGPDDFAAMNLPILLVTGNFDLSIGTLDTWNGLTIHGPERDDRLLLIGPWDHSGAYVGGGERYGPFDLGSAGGCDPHIVRKAFFDLHLKGEGTGPELSGKAKLFVTGRNEYLSFAGYPPKGISPTSLFLASQGRANTWRGDGVLACTPPLQAPDDCMRADPEWPFVAVMAEATGRIREVCEQACHSETLVYSGEPLSEPLIIMGEPEAFLHVATNTPDADICVQLCELRHDGTFVQLSQHMLRLRYREGFDYEVLMTPGEPVEARVRLTYLGHEFAAGSRIALLVHPNMFPWVDPNPNTGKPGADGTDPCAAEIRLLHDIAHPSRVELPVLPAHLPDVLSTSKSL